MRIPVAPPLYELWQEYAVNFIISEEVLCEVRYRKEKPDMFI
jgi:hypothetical protein